MSLLVYYSSTSENTHRFVQKLGVRSLRIPNRPEDAAQFVPAEPFVLLTPTYGGGNAKGAVPKPVVHFLNNAVNRQWLRGTLSSGNTNFGEAYCLAGKIIAQKCQVPYLYSFELLGTPEDVVKVQTGLLAFWQKQQAQELSLAELASG